MGTSYEIQGHLLDVIVIGCSKLKNTELLTKQDPYLTIDYGNHKYRTRTCTDGGKNPTFNEKFQITLLEGLREFHFAVWNSCTLRSDIFIGSGRVLLHKVLSEGFDDSTWMIQTESSKFAGEVKLVMHFSKPSLPPPPSPCACTTLSIPQCPHHSHPFPHHGNHLTYGPPTPPHSSMVHSYHHHHYQPPNMPPQTYTRQSSYYAPQGHRAHPYDMHPYPPPRQGPPYHYPPGPYP